jgi:hypothetical protein
MPVKTFRGLMADDTQDTILLHTNTGSTGYRITKMQLIPNAPGSATAEHIVKVYKTEQTTNVSTIDFSDNTLLAAGYSNNDTAGDDNPPVVNAVIFDQEIFNQDIYVTHKIRNGTGSINYYIELEQIKLALDENTVATLKDIRNITAP